ncbi:structural maintenance of chromosomes protein 5-like [Lampetra fluviatilis]
MDPPYVNGSVKRIRLVNFVTYTEVEFYPGPSLNLVIGPNATGKSTIVSALCLGLAGKPSLLGRGDKMGQFVKRGEAKATVELELARAVGGDVVVRREICAASNSSTWFLSGRSASQKQVEEVVSSFNIQVSNLCQFLPQEKVGEFAKLSRVDRLEATEKSVGSSDLYDLHQRLKTLQKSRSNTEATLLERSSRLEKLRQRQQLQSHDVELYHSHQRHNDYAQLLAKKRVWLEYELTRGSYLELRLRVEASAEEERRLSHLVAPLLAQQQQQKQREGDLNQKLRRKQQQQKQREGDLNHKLRRKQQQQKQREGDLNQKLRRKQQQQHQREGDLNHKLRRKQQQQR